MGRLELLSVTSGTRRDRQDRLQIHVLNHIHQRVSLTAIFVFTVLLFCMSVCNFLQTGARFPNSCSSLTWACCCTLFVSSSAGCRSWQMSRRRQVPASRCGLKVFERGTVRAQEELCDALLHLASFVCNFDETDFQDPPGGYGMSQGAAAYVVSERMQKACSMLATQASNGELTKGPDAWIVVSCAISL